jgi:hypothetical protein
VSEFLADPAAVGDNEGEWVEIHNPGDEPVNLRGWQLADLGTERHTIEGELLIAPGAFIVLGRNADSSINGGAPVDYVYDGLSLANGEDELLLLAPDAREVDRVVWGDGSLALPRGASLQRALPDDPDAWFVSTTPWPGSAGDLGTPGSGPDAAPPPTGTPPPAVTPTPAPPPVTGDAWPLAEVAGPLIIEEVAFRSGSREFVALHNAGDAPLLLDGWSIGDAERPGDGEGMYALLAGTTLAPGESFVIARDGSAFLQEYGRAPDAQFENADNGVPALVPRADLATGQWALSDSGDEAVLLNPAGVAVDAFVYGNGDYAALGRSGELRPPGDFSLQHVLGAGLERRADQRRRILYGPPAPFELRMLPQGNASAAMDLDGGLLAVWGSLGARSNFTPGFTAPPAYLAAAARAAGLDFMALADAQAVTNPGDDTSIITLPAWRWEDGDGDAAVVFAPTSAEVATRHALQEWLAANDAYALWLDGELLESERLRAVDAGNVTAPGNLGPLLDAWRAAVRPLLPGGTANPPLPGRFTPGPRYTGLAVTAASEAQITEAIAGARGWLSSAPGLWLTLRIERQDGTAVWMGDSLDPASAVTFHVQYGDRTGEVAGLTLWRNDRPWQQLDIPPDDGRWSITAPALPGSRYFVVATQTDGDFAVTAPIQVRGGSETAAVRIDEVVFAPSNDLNGDGVHNDDDEFVELYNPSGTPVDLSGWQLANRWSDEVASRRYTFREGSYLDGGARLVLWREELRFYLEDVNDYVRLLAPDGREVDRAEWGGWNGGSVGRDDEGGDWQNNTVALPGAPYGGLYGTGNHPETIPDPGEGQAGGPPGSLAQAKRFGLQRWVEFEAIVTVPPGLFNGSMYVADPAADGATGGLGIRVYLRSGELPPLAEGDRVRIRGRTTSFRGEMEVSLDSPAQAWRVEGGPPLQPLSITPAEVGESLEGRLVTFEGIVTGYQGDSIYLGDPGDSEAEPVRVTVRSSLDWRRPYVNEGERFTVVGIVSQFASEKPWNGGYRVLVRYPEDLLPDSIQ